MPHQQLSEEGRTGRRHILVAAGVVIFADLWVILVYNLSVGSDRLFVQLGRVILAGLLFWLVYKGYSWARSVALMMYGIGLLAMTLTLYAMGWAQLTLAALLGWAGFAYTIWMLQFSSKTRAFLRHQRALKLQSAA